MSIFVKAIHFQMSEKHLKEFRRLWSEMISKNEAAWTPMVAGNRTQEGEVMSNEVTAEEEYILKLQAELARERALVEKLRLDTALAVKESREAREILTADGWDMGGGYDLPGAVSVLLENREEMRAELIRAREGYDRAIVINEEMRAALRAGQGWKAKP